MRAGKKENDVDAFMQALDHPLKAEIEAAREIILSARAGIEEGVKWNAPSFRTADYFATIHLRAKTEVQIILHTGAKAKSKRMEGAIDDPRGLLRWLAPDRALVSLGAGAAFQANRPALRALIRGWTSAL